MSAKEVIAVLENKSAIAREVKESLTMSGYRVLEVKTVKDFPKQVTLDLILADGQQVVTEIRKKAPGIPVLLLGPHVGEGVVPPAGSGGMVGYVPNPLDRSELLSKVREFMEGRGAEKTVVSATVGRSHETYLTAHVRPELHDPASGRLDAEKIARVLGVPISDLSKAVGLTPAAVQKNPAARSIQDTLSKIAFCYITLERVLGTRKEAVTWLNAPHPDFGGRAPLSVIREGKAEAVVGLLNDALAGQMS